MATFIVGSWVWLPGGFDPDGHRTWKVQIKTQGDPNLDGPATHALTPGLPLPGATYSAYHDLDIWAWCHGERTISPYGPYTQGGVTHFIHEFTFSTKPAARSPNERDDKGARKKCSDQTVQDPLMEPPAISRNSIRETREEWFDNGGGLLVYTSFEQMRGPAVTFDRHRDQVTIEQNLLDPQDKDMPGYIDFVNDQPLWDLPARCWKLCDRRWQRKSYGTCGFYYVRSLVFESNAEDVTSLVTGNKPFPYSTFAVLYNGKNYLTHWDHYIADESNKMIAGSWGANGGDYVPLPWVDRKDPRAYIAAKDRFYENTRIPLSNDPAHRGEPAKDPLGTRTGTSDMNWIRVNKYQQANFLLLGIPTTLSP
jgi:hypothetical protein